MDIFAQRFNYLLESRRVSKADVSRSTGIPKTTLSKYGNGTRANPRRDTLRKLAVYFDTSVDYLLGVTDKEVVQ